jgi:hypothetical protein
MDRSRDGGNHGGCAGGGEAAADVHGGVRAADPQGVYTRTTPGAIGALLRRGGLYSSHLVEWRRVRGRRELAALTPKKRRRKPTPVDPRDRKITVLERAGADDWPGGAGRGPGGGPKKNLAALLGRPGASAQPTCAVTGPAVSVALTFSSLYDQSNAG